MDKKPGFIIIVFLFIGATIGFYLFLKNRQSPNVEIFSAIPVNAVLIVEIDHPRDLIQSIKIQNQFIAELAELNSVNHFITGIYKIDSLAKNNPEIQQHYNLPKLVFSFHEIGNGKFEALFLANKEGFFNSNSALKTLEEELGKGGIVSTDRYNQVKVYHFKNNEYSFYYCSYRGIIMGSSSEVLLQDAIRQTESDSGINSNPAFQKVQKTAGTHVDAHVYINFKTSDNIFTKIFDSEIIEKNGFNEIGEWVELDLNIKNQSLVFNGFGNNSGNTSQFYTLFKNQEPQDLGFIKCLPSVIESFCAFGISNYQQYIQNLQNYMEQTNQGERFLINRQLLISTFGDGFDKRLGEILKGELTQVSLSGGETLFFLRTTGYRNANELILNWLDSYCTKSGNAISDFKLEYKIDNETAFPIYKMPIDFFPTRLLGPWFKDCQASYVTVFDGYMIFGGSFQSLSKTIYNNVLQKTLIYDEPFNEFAEFLSNKANFYAFFSLTGTGNNLNDVLSKKANDYFETNKKELRDFYGIAWQFSNENQMIYNSLLFKYQPTTDKNAIAVWETRLDTTISAKPELVVNHTSKEKEILVQDSKNNIYLINKSGRVLWKKSLKETVMGDIQQVDYYRNGKLQYLFNTRTQLHLIDRNGNYVERYPLALPVAAVNSLTLVDYEKQRNYRIFVPCDDQKVYGYEINGKFINGFKFDGTDQPIIAPVQYVQDNSIDYLIITDKSRIYIIDRKGNNRLTLNKQFSASANNLFEYQPGNSSRKGRLLRTSTDGTIQFIYFNGDVEQMHLMDATQNHFFDFEDATGDRVPDFVFVDDKKLSVFSLKGEKEFEVTFSTPIRHKPAFYHFSNNQSATGITEASAHKIYLFNNKGEIMKGFPLPGITRFSIGTLEPGKGYSLIVGGDEQYLYNYKLD